MGPTPLLATTTSTALANGATIDDAAAHAHEGCDPTADLNASIDYRNHLARTLTKRALPHATT